MSFSLPVESPERALRHLLTTFERFDKVLEATTAAEPGGGRRVGSLFHAGALNEATRAVHAAMATMHQSLLAQYGRPVTSPPPFTIMESDSPDGPWTPVPLETASVRVMAVGPAGVGSLLAAALVDGTDVTAMRDGSDSVRWKPGDVIGEADLEKLARIGKLLRLHRPEPDTTTASNTNLQSRSAGSADQELDKAMLSVADLASRFGVDSEALRKRLERARPKLSDNDFIEDGNPAANRPKYLYRLGAVRPIAEKMSSRGQRPASDRTSVRRPTAQ